MVARREAHAAASTRSSCASSRARGRAAQPAPSAVRHRHGRQLPRRCRSRRGGSRAGPAGASSQSRKAPAWRGARRRPADRSARPAACRPTAPRTSESSPRTKLRSQAHSRWSKSGWLSSGSQVIDSATRVPARVALRRCSQCRADRRRGAPGGDQQVGAAAPPLPTARSSWSQGRRLVAEQADQRASPRRAMPWPAQPGVAVEAGLARASRSGSRSRPPVRGVKPG